MPKLKVSEDEQWKRNVRGAIARGMEAQGLDDEAISKKMPFCKKTFQNKRKRPETFTVGEMRLLAKALKLSSDELIVIGGGKID